MPLLTIAVAWLGTSVVASLVIARMIRPHHAQRVIHVGRHHRPHHHAA
jgi:hypothetical protein